MIEYILVRFDLFLFILVRISGLFISAPIFSSKNMPSATKIGLSMLITIIILPIIPPQELVFNSLLLFVINLIGELAIGFLMGFCLNLVFAAIQTAGQLIDMQMGFGMVNVFDPQSGLQVPLMGNFKYLLALLLFLIVNGHHFFIYAIVNSFYHLPIQSFSFTSDLFQYMIQLFVNSFALAIQISLPVFGALFLTEIALGIMARTVPQMNVFIVGIPAKIVIGIMIMFISMPIYVYFLRGVFDMVYNDVMVLFSLMQVV